MANFQFALCVTFLSLVAFASAITFEQDTVLTKQQSQAFKKFKERVTPKLLIDWQKEDLHLLRFLRAKKFDVNKAEEFILAQMKWRRDNKMETIHTEDFSDLESTGYGMRVSGVDRDGRPLIVWELGDFDLRKAALAGKTDRVIRWTFRNWDAGRRAVRDLELQNKNVTRWTMVLDLKNINAVTNVNSASFPYYIAASLGYDLHWPHWGDNIYLINTPGLFETVLTLVKPGLAQGTRDSLHVFGKGKEAEWGPALKAAVDDSQLPQRYGGLKEDP